ncbi:MAG TPA: hypothetical protein VFK82_00800 [Burkholderiaceae bacterium]|nr:hypothetical protein [Burkholderiaceae bacterium]
MSKAWRAEWQSRLLNELAALQQLRVAEGELAASLMQLQSWQRARLARTYADQLAEPATEPAGRFFLEQLYCPADQAAQRDADVQRIVPTLAKLLPEVALQAIGDAVSLDLLSADLDVALTRTLERARLPLDDTSYARAYATLGRPADRQRQIDLTRRCGELLAQAVKLPLIMPTVKMMELPARAAGLQRLHTFLVQGLVAFKALPSPQAFLDVIESRETALMQGWLAAARIA